MAENLVNHKSSKTVLLLSLIATLTLANILFIIFTTREAKTTTLLKSELTSLEQNELILSSAKTIYERYQNEINLINAVFPNEETIPIFIQNLEQLIRANADQYSVKFNSVTPLSEEDKLLLPLTITMKTDLSRLLRFFEELEQFPYMTHINSVLTKAPDGFGGGSEVILGLKVYVQKPFTTE